MKGAYYNEIDPYAAQWLRNLIGAGLIAAGDVDERSIVDVQPDDLKGYAQCHFFAGIGGWSLALRLAGWPDDRPVWTGSCPCQPLSGAGQRKGHADERHLWPAFYRLIAERRPATVFGEQVASADGREWLAGIRADLEAVGYAVGAADLCAAGVGAPHIRQRLFWLADATRGGRRELRDAAWPRRGGHAHGGDAPSGMADTNGGLASDGGIQRRGEQRQQPQDGGVGGVGDAERPERRSLHSALRTQGGNSLSQGQEGAGRLGEPGAFGFWRDFDLIPCTDGRARRVEPGTFPLAHGIPNRVGRLRAYGNAIVPQVAAAFIRAAFPE